jgi:20S proteasome subunit alpha 1
MPSPWLLTAFAQLAIEALSTVHATDFKADEVEIGIVSTSEDEDEKTRGLWRTLSEEELDEHLSAYVEKD